LIAVPVIVYLHTHRGSYFLIGEGVQEFVRLRSYFLCPPPIVIVIIILIRSRCQRSEIGRDAQRVRLIMTHDGLVSPKAAPKGALGANPLKYLARRNRSRASEGQKLAQLPGELEARVVPIGGTLVLTRGAWYTTSSAFVGDIVNVPLAKEGLSEVERCLGYELVNVANVADCLESLEVCKDRGRVRWWLCEDAHEEVYRREGVLGLPQVVHDTVTMFEKKV
jgi:hypothetical protein